MLSCSCRSRNLFPRNSRKVCGITRLGQLLYLFIVLVATLMNLLLEDGPVEFGLIREIPENNGFIDISVCRKVPGCRAPKSVLREQFHCSLQDFMTCFVLGHVSKYLLTWVRLEPQGIFTLYLKWEGDRAIE